MKACGAESWSNSSAAMCGMPGELESGMSGRYVEYARQTFTRSAWSGCSVLSAGADGDVRGANMPSSGQTVFVACTMAVLDSLLLAFSSAILNVVSVTSRSFPTAFCQTCPRNRGGMPFHHIFLCEARRSEVVISAAHEGRSSVDQYSDFMREAFSRASASDSVRWASRRSRDDC